MTLMSTVKAGAVALVLGATALAAVPAQAAPPSFQFSFDFGNGGGGPGMKFNFGNKHKICLSDKQIVWQLRDYGFRNIKIWKSKGYQAVVVARWHGDWYQLLVDRCTGKIERAPLKKYKGFGDPGVGFTLHFGM
jgi:hypothetical protein